MDLGYIQFFLVLQYYNYMITQPIRFPKVEDSLIVKGYWYRLILKAFMSAFKLNKYRHLE